MSHRMIVWVAVACLATACAGDDAASHDDAAGPDGDAHAHAPHDADGGASALDAFLAGNAIRDEAGWMRVGLSHSDVTGGPRRVFVDKYAVVQALLAWGGEGDDGAPAPLAYAPGTVFVAENLDAPDGDVASTFVIRFDDDGAPTFTAYDRAGALADTFGYLVDGAPTTGSVPADCRACHLGERVYPPLSAFPAEDARVAVAVDPRHRDAALVGRFGEAYTRGSGVFGPYGGLLVAALAADRADGRLAKTDEMSLFMLAQRYAELLGMTGGFGDDDGEGDER